MASVTVRVISYNILSSSLSDPSFHIGSKVEDCDPKVRYVRCLEKLKEEIGFESILCLQEVSQDWASKLYVFFAENEYTFITSLYGNHFDGYMGVAIAFPNNKYKLTECEIIRVSETKPFPKSNNKNKKSTNGISSNIYNFVLNSTIRSSNYVRTYLPYWLGGNNLIEPSQDSSEKIYQLASQRRNTMINLRLMSKEDIYEEGKDETPEEISSLEGTFCISTYHMPCSYEKPKLMIIHASLAAQQVQKFAANSPYIFCGDFNSKPDSAVYELLGTSKLSNKDNYPGVTDPVCDWSIDLKEGMLSAYFDCLEREPEFTIRSDTKWGKFVDCIDYIFMHPDCQIVDVIELPSCSEDEGTYPCFSEPSDHLMIGASIEIPL